MPCTHPFKAFKTGHKTENGKDDLIIAFDDCESSLLDLDRCKKPVDLSLAPHVFRHGHYFLSDPISVPCGNCIGCRMDRAREWKIRNCLELASHPEAYFVTITYNDSCLPINEDGEAYLCKSDFQKFLKRLRKYIGPFRYFGCGEYGENTARPHAHFIIYGHLSGFRLVGVNKFESADVSRAWRFGMSVVENVTPGSIAYVSGYVEKKWKVDVDKFPVKPFLMMSRKPGIGMQYFASRDDFEQDMQVYGHFSESVMHSHAPVPKSFRRKLQDLPWYEDWKQAAILAGESMENTLKVVYGCADYARRHNIIDQALYKKMQKVRKECL